MVGQLPRRRPPRRFTALEAAVRGLGAHPPGRDYETFRAWLYALDVFIPLDALEQEKTWAPSASPGWWGELGHRLRWLVQMSGWVITAIGAAVVTGLIGRRD